MLEICIIVLREAMANKKTTDLLIASDLKKYYPLGKKLLSRGSKVLKAVDGVSISFKEGEIMGLVGESGCGKSTLARLIVCLEEPTDGEIIFEGRHLLELNAMDLKKVRQKIQIIFQDPFSSLDPRQRVGDAILEPFDIHFSLPRAEKESRVRELMEAVGLHPEDMGKYPREFSGGQRQRIVIARALALGPRFLVADEPVSSLDVSIQAQVVNLLLDLHERFSLNLLFISHDLKLVEQISDRVAVMYLGKIVEQASRRELAVNPLHPYTEALYESTPSLSARPKRNFTPLKDAPSPAELPRGCRYNTRCPKAIEVCLEHEPELKSNGRDHMIACFLHN